MTEVGVATQKFSGEPLFLNLPLYIVDLMQCSCVSPDKQIVDGASVGILSGMKEHLVEL